MSDTNTSELSYQAQIVMDIENMPERLKFPDKSNRGKSFALLILWKKVSQMAEKKYEKLLETMINDEMIDDPKSISTPGNHVLAESGKFSVQVNVSVPRREFNADWLANRLMKDYKVPVSMTKQLIEEAKRPGTTQVRRITVAEKGS
jgi:hypothetical protein